MLIDRLKEKFGADIIKTDSALGEDSIVIVRDKASEIFHTLHDDGEFGFEFLIDVTAVDWLERHPRFDVVYQLKSMSRNHRLRVKIQVDAGDEAWVPSA